MGPAFIINPKACRGAAIQKWKRFSALLSKSGVEYLEYYTSRPQEAEKLARKAAQRSKEIYAVGGDGTLFEVANGLQKTDAALGLIPFGTGNDFSRSLKIPENDFEAIIEMVKKGKKKRIDLGRVNGKIYCNVVGIGFDGEVALAANNPLKAVGGTPAYVWGIIKTLFSYKAPRMKIDIDGRQIEKEALLTAVGNGGSYGGGIKILPQARFDDGFLDICVVDRLHPLKVLLLFPLLYSGRHVKNKNVHIYQGKRIRIESDPPVVVQADGELITRTPVELEIISRGINFIVC